MHRDKHVAHFHQRILKLSPQTSVYHNHNQFMDLIEGRLPSNKYTKIMNCMSVIKPNYDVDENLTMACFCLKSLNRLKSKLCRVLCHCPPPVGVPV